MNAADAELFDRYETLTAPWSDALDLVIDALPDPQNRVEALTEYIEQARGLRPRMGATPDEVRVVELLCEPARREIDRTLREYPPLFAFDPANVGDPKPSRWRFLTSGLPGFDGYPSPEETARRIVERVLDEQRIAKEVQP